VASAFPHRYRLTLTEEQVFALDDLLDKYLNEKADEDPKWFHGMDMQSLSVSHDKLMALIQRRIDRGEI